MTQKIYLLRIVAQSIKQSWHSRNRIVPFALKYSQALIMYNTDGETQSRLYDEYMLGTSREDGVSLANEFVPHVIVISFTTLEAKEISRADKKCLSMMCSSSTRESFYWRGAGSWEIYRSV